MVMGGGAGADNALFEGEAHDLSARPKKLPRDGVEKDGPGRTGRVLLAGSCDAARGGGGGGEGQALVLEGLAQLLVLAPEPLDGVGRRAGRRARADPVEGPGALVERPGARGKVAGMEGRYQAVARVEEVVVERHGGAR